MIDKWIEDEKELNKNEINPMREMLAKTHEESSLLSSMSEAMWIGMKEIIREKGNEFDHEVGPIEHIFGVPRN